MCIRPSNVRNVPFLATRAIFNGALCVYCETVVEIDTGMMDLTHSATTSAALTMNSFTGSVTFSLLCISGFPKLNKKCTISFFFLFFLTFSSLSSLFRIHRWHRREGWVLMSDSRRDHTCGCGDELVETESIQRVGSLNRLFEVFSQALVPLRGHTHSHRNNVCVDVGPVMREQEEEATTRRDSHSASKASPLALKISKIFLRLQFLKFLSFIMEKK